MKTGILLTNTGTPDSPSVKSVRRYLREFLSDPRIVQIPKLLWYPILYGLVLPLRGKRSAALYQSIWTTEGSPMRVLMQSLTAKLEVELGHNYLVEIGMNYGHQSIADGMKALQQRGAKHYLILPLFPQYSTTSTGATFDRILPTVQTFDIDQSPLISVRSYSSNKHYINQLATSVKAHWQKNTVANHLLISFHGIPERLIKQGDPYQHECELTANALAQELGLLTHQWTLCYQSQFGYDKWLKPSTQRLLSELPQNNHHDIDIICPGFAIDCLETLEEITKTGREIFLASGGRSLNYISALNNSDQHIKMLAEIVHEYHPLSQSPH